MEAVLYICHGSRLPEARREAITFVEMCKNLRSESIQEYCYLELAEPTIPQAIAKCVAKGATKIRAIPILLLTATHAKIDIPKQLEEGLKPFPAIVCEFGKPMGIHPKIIEVLHERIKQKGRIITPKSKIFLVGRGSTDLGVKRDLTIIARLLSEKIGHSVEPCFLTGCEPYFSEVINMLKNVRKIDQVFIVPYFLFTGLLMKGIERTIKECASKNFPEFILCDYLRDSLKVVDVLNEKIDEIELNKLKPQSIR